MNKLLSLVLVFLCPLLLSGCKKSLIVTPVTVGLCYSANCSFNGTNFFLDCQIEKNNNTKFCLYFSDKTEAVQLYYKEPQIVVSHGELKYTTSIEEFTFSRVTQLLYYTFKDLSESAEIDTAQDNFYSVKGKTKDFEYELLLSTAGLPIRLTEKNYKIEVEFSKQKIIS